MLGFFVETSSMALGALYTREKLPCPFLSTCGRLVGLLHLDIFHKPIIGQEIVVGAQSLGFDIESLVGAIHDVVESLFGQQLKGSVECGTMFLANRRNLPKDERVLVLAQRSDASIFNRQLHVGHDFLAVDDVHKAQPLALGASSLRRVK